MKNSRMIESNYIAADRNKDTPLTSLDFKSLKNNPVYGRRYNFKPQERGTNDGITITDINAVNYAHMNKSEFKKRRKKELKLNNFNRKFKMGQRKNSNLMVTSKISSTPRDRSLGNLTNKSINRGRNIRSRLKVEEIIKKVKMEKDAEDATRRTLFVKEKKNEGVAAEVKKQPFIAKRFDGFKTLGGNVQGAADAERHFLQRNVNRPRALSHNRLVKKMPSKAFETMQGGNVSSNNLRNHTMGFESFNRLINRGWRKSKVDKVIDFTEKNIDKMPYKEKENVARAYDSKPYSNPYANLNVSDQKIMQERPVRKFFGKDTPVAEKETEASLLRVNQVQDFTQKSFDERAVEQDSVNIRDSEIEVKNPLKSNYGSYYKIPFHVKKDKSLSGVRKRNGILKNRDNSTVKKGRSKSVKFKEQAEVNDNTTVRLKEDGEGKKPVPKK